MKSCSPQYPMIVIFFRTLSINAQCWSMPIKILALIRNTSHCQSLLLNGDQGIDWNWSAMIGIGINPAILISIDPMIQEVLLSLMQFRFSVGRPLYSCNEKFCIILVQSIKVNLSRILITFEYQSRVCLSCIPSHEFEYVYSWMLCVQLSIPQYVALWISNGNFSRVKFSKTVIWVRRLLASTR